MKQIRLFLATLLALLMGTALHAQDKKTVTLRIKMQSEGEFMMMDTTFEVSDESEINAVLESLGIGEAKEGQYVEKTITIREPGHNANHNYVVAGTAHKPTALIGIYLDEDTELPRGVKISKVTDGGGASLAGIEDGDIVLRIGERTVNSYEEIGESKKGFVAGDVVEFEYERDGTVHTTMVTLQDAKMAKHYMARYKGKMVEYKKAFLGINLGDNGDNDGVYISGIVKESGAEAAGLAKGDVIVAMDGQEVANTKALGIFLKNKEPGDEVKIKYLRSGKKQSTRATLGERVYHKWQRSDTPEIDVEVFAKVFSDREQAEGLLRQMKSPDLASDRFVVFPNPSDGSFTLSFILNERGNTQIRIYSTMGELVYAENLSSYSGSYEKVIEISDQVSEGIYLLQVTQNGKGMVRRIVIR